jgi:putative ABC transport system ATP-binding protein
MLKLDQVCLIMGSQTILSAIDLTVAETQIVMCLGSNGSGKSSLLKLIDRRYPLQKGECHLASIPLRRYSAKQLARAVITLTQNPLDSLFAQLTVEENARLAGHRAAGRLKKEVLREHLHAFNPKLVHHLDTLAGQLSGGEQQALTLALACLAKPKLLLLDEHTSALDPHTADHLMQLTSHTVKAQGITCLISTHHVEHALRYGDRLIALKQGKIVQDYNQAAKAQLSVADVRRACY